MKPTWVVVADSTRARILLAENAIGPLREIETLVHPESRLHAQELTTDTPGRVFDSGGQGRHAMGQPVDPKHQERIDFARELTQHLEQARRRGDLRQLIIVASPQVLGELRKAFSPETARLVTQELDKNLAQRGIDEIRRHLPERLPTLAA